ncbi:MAG: SRPBCC domain-containing protein [Bacteroidetes bacterium]|nr:MAG: SRPBCC domain-containing protein [Bacteroidota bacterium]
MQNKNFTTAIVVDQTPEEVFNAINDPRAWWSEEIEGSTVNINDVFDYHYEDVHSCKVKLVEVVPDKKVVWKILDNHFNFTKDKTEWINTKVSFEISKQGEKTQLVFTHIGLVPEYECYEACHQGWTHYIQSSLKGLIETGKGLPNAKGTPRTATEEKFTS